MQEVKKRFSKWLEEYRSNKEAPEYINDSKLKGSKIDKVMMFRDFPAIIVHFSDEPEQYYVGPRVTQFYKRCMQEIGKEKRGEAPDPYYFLSKDLLDKINKYYQLDVSNFEITQAEINQLFEQYHLKISQALAHNKGKSTIVLLGECHGISLMQDLMVFEILKDKETTGRKLLKNLFIELDSESYKKNMESKKIYSATDFDDSFLFLSHLAHSYNIQTIPVENSLARDIYATWKSNITMYIRDHYMASNITKTGITSKNDISIVLCGANHIKGLKSRLEKAGFNILELDVHDFQIKSKNGMVKLMVFEKDIRDIHMQVLLAKQALMEKTGYFKTLPVEVIDASELKRKTADSKKTVLSVLSPPRSTLSESPSPSMPPSSSSDIQTLTQTKSLGADFAMSSQMSKRSNSSKISTAPLITSHGLLRSTRTISMPNLSTENSEIKQKSKCRSQEI